MKFCCKSEEGELFENVIKLESTDLWSGCDVVHLLDVVYRFIINKWIIIFLMEVVQRNM
jgi:hypothetical protein